MLHLIRTDSENLDFKNLVRQLDEDLAIRDGADHAFYDQFNKIVAIKYAIVAYKNEIAVGCGAIKEWAADTVEVKRMYVTVIERGKGIASFVLKELENWAGELGYKKAILETGKNQPEALGLYKKSRYYIIPNYGQYENMANSVCFEKRLET